MVPVSTVAVASAANARVRASWGDPALMAGASPAIMMASGAAVLLSGPAAARRKPLVHAIRQPVATVVISAAATPWPRNGCSGPVETNAPYEKHNASDNSAVTRPAQTPRRA